MIENIKKLNINDDLIEIVYDYKIENETLKFNAFTNFKKSIYQPEEYSRLKSHLDELIMVFNQDIILKNLK